MKGTRQGNFSRLLFDRRKHYRAVHKQQARFNLDSDWNAQVALARYRQETETADVLGGAAAPAGEAGFGLAVSGGLELGPDRHHVVIGGSEGCRWQVPPAETPELTLEARLIPRGDGVVFSRWLVGEEGLEPAGQPEPAGQLELAAGRLRYSRPGQAELVSDPLELVDRPCHLAVVSRADGTSLWVDGEKVAEAQSRVPPRGLERNRLVLAAGLQDGRPVDELDAHFFDFRVWAGPRSEEQIRAGIDRPPVAGEALLGWWTFDDARGDRVRDHGGECNHGALQGSAEPPGWRPDRLTISAGRFYVDGLLCENERTVDFEQQADDPGLELPRRRGVFLFYLDAWEREVNAIEDPDLLDSAFKGADTTTRVRAIAQVRVLELASEAEGGDPPEWQRLLAAERRRGALRVRCRPIAGSELGNDFYRIEVHHGGACLGGRRPIDGDGATPAQVEQGGRALRLEPGNHAFAPGQPVEVYAPAADGEGEVAVVEAVDAPADEPVTLRLDRVVTLPGEAMVRRLASFKWSRDNASHCYPIAGLGAEGRLVKTGLSARKLDFCAGAWLEVLDDLAVLQRKVEPLCEVESVESSKNEVRLAKPAPVGIGGDPARHPMLRVWDQDSKKRELLPSGVELATAGWQGIDKGVQLEFVGDAAYRSGDYWTVPSRHLAQDVEWPRDADGEPLASAPHGVDHHYAPLALLVHDEEGFRLDDLRRTFHPLATGAVSKAGDAIEGDLTVRGSLEVWQDLEVRGQARLGEIYGRLCGQDMVDTPQLVDGSVTLRKLAPGVGVVPVGYSILGPPESPPGYVATGSRLTLFNEVPEWVDRFEIPSPSRGPYASVAIDGKVYTLLETGELWGFDPAANAWRRGRELPVGLRRFAVAAVAGRLHVVGGLDPAGNGCADHLVYDPLADDWHEAKAMPTARCDLALAVFDGRLHALGGLRQVPALGWLLGRYATTRHEVYDPGTDTWHSRRPMPEARYTLAAASTGTAIHAVGGQRRWLFRLWGRIRTHRHLLYQPANDSWSACARLPSPRSHLGLVAAGGRLFAVGGRGPGWMADCESYDPRIDRWEPLVPLHEPIEHPGVTAVEGDLYVTGARRFPGAPGVLVEQCQVVTVYHVHRRGPGRPDLSDS